MSTIEQLKAFAASVNVASELDKEELDRIGQRVLLGFNEDMKSMEEWLEDVKKVEELASLVTKPKNTPLPNSANVKLPIITKACYEFSSSTYPEIIRDDKLVKVKIMGKDLDGSKSAMADRVSAFMNYQLLFEHQEWELELDRLLNLLALIGFICKKTYYDPIRKMVKSEICDYKELIINSDVKSLEDASRISQILHLRLNDFVEAKNTEIDGVPIFLADPVEELEELYKTDELDKCIDVIEQHCKLDLDEDGYAEPYIVTITKEQGKVLRISPRFNEDGISVENKKICYIDPIKYFVDYHFLVSPKGKFQSVGFGLLLLHLNESTNSVLNQILDAGQLANMQGGYKDARLKMIASGNTLHDPGEWKEVKVMAGTSLEAGMKPIAYKEPSAVMYQLLQLLLEVSRDLSSSAQINNGTQSSENAKTGATLALQQAGKKVFNSITKRIYRSLTNEFRQIFVLNGLYLNPEEYREVLDDTLAVKQTDFDIKKLAIFPVADPNLSSEPQRIADAQFIASVQMLPGIDPLKATKLILEKSRIPGIEDILADPDADQAPNPEDIKVQADIQKMADESKQAGHKLALAEKELELKAVKLEAEIAKLKADTMLSLANAEAVDSQTTLKDLQMQLDGISEKLYYQMELTKMNHEAKMQNNEHQLQKAGMAKEAPVEAPDA